MFDSRARTSSSDKQISPAFRGSRYERAATCPMILKRSQMHFVNETSTASCPVHFAPTIEKTRLERMAEGLGMVSWTPLWHQSGHEHLKGMIEHGFEIMITGVSAEGLNEAWLGTCF